MPGDVASQGQPAHLPRPLVLDGRQDARVHAPALEDPQDEEGVEVIVTFGRIKAPSILQAAVRRGEPQEEI
eukprot:9808187-Alexandrium_andersonii.AAC.1